jgi:hypothetical protein
VSASIRVIALLAATTFLTGVALPAWAVVATVSTNTGSYAAGAAIRSGTLSLLDAGALSGKTTAADNLVASVAVQQQENSTDMTATVSIETRPVAFTLRPLPKLEYVLVLDITSSMLQPLRDQGTGQSRWEKFWDERIRMYKMRESVKAAAREIWSANPDSTLTIVPYAADVLKPRASHDGFDYGPNFTGYFYALSGADTGAFDTVHVPADAVVDDYASQAANEALTRQYDYYQLSLSTTTAAKADFLRTFDASIDALPVCGDTGTEYGMQAALELFEDNVGFTANEARNRIALLITDGQANAYPGRQGTQWEYYHEAADRIGVIADSLRNSARGNATVAVVSIDPEPVVFNPQGWVATGLKGAVIYDEQGELKYLQTLPADNRVFDARKNMKDAWANPGRFYDAATDAIGQTVSHAIAELQPSTFYGGLQTVLTERIDTRYFQIEPSSLDVTVTVDGRVFRLGDADCPLTAQSLTITPSGIEVRLGVAPYGALLTHNSLTRLDLSFRVSVKAGVTLPSSKTGVFVPGASSVLLTPPAHPVGSSYVLSWPSSGRVRLDLGAQIYWNPANPELAPEPLPVTDEGNKPKPEPEPKPKPKPPATPPRTDQPTGDSASWLLPVAALSIAIVGLALTGKQRS